MVSGDPFANASHLHDTIAPPLLTIGAAVADENETQ